MKSHLDQIMAARNLDAFLVLGDSGGNPVMNYLTAGAHLEQALIFKQRGGPLTLIHGSMERDTAAQTGLVLIERDQHYNRNQLLKEHQGDRLAAEVAYLRKVVQDQKLHGRLGIYGMQDAGAAYMLLNMLNDSLIETQIVGEFGDTLFSLARETKDDRELTDLREAGRLTSMILGEVQEFLQQRAVRRNDETLLRADGEVLTIGDVKAFIRSRVFAHGMSEDHGNIFSLGRDAGVPHNSGDPAAPLRLGQSIVFDFFPQVASGYFHDVTRTWSLGYATDEVQLAWDQCKEIFDQVMGNLRLGTHCRDYQLQVCDYFESKGHPTARSHPGTHVGYVHSLGHGLGLNIHEEPRLSHATGNETRLQPGHVVSVEPGLYYPERGFGVRIEDSVAFTEAGELINLTSFPYDLVLPMRQ